MSIEIRERPAGTERRDMGRHWAARPMPPPPFTARASKFAREPLDATSQLLEQWLSELRISGTEAGD